MPPVDPARRAEVRRLKNSGMSYAQVAKHLGIAPATALNLYMPPMSERRKLMARANGHCERCGQPCAKLHGHHYNYDGDGVPDIFVCPKCHGFFHRATGWLRRLARQLYFRPESSPARYLADIELFMRAIVPPLDTPDAIVQLRHAIRPGMDERRIQRYERVSRIVEAWVATKQQKASE